MRPSSYSAVPDFESAGISIPPAVAEQASLKKYALPDWQQSFPAEHRVAGAAKKKATSTTKNGRALIIPIFSFCFECTPGEKCKL
jgi:hypothetical protein